MSFLQIYVDGFTRTVGTLSEQDIKSCCEYENCKIYDISNSENVKSLNKALDWIEVNHD